MDITLRTGIWYNDRPITLTFPERWVVQTHWPKTPPPLGEGQIRKILRTQRKRHPPLATLAEGKQNPLIIIDDLSRPTPVARILPFILEEFQQAGIDANRIRILVATGTHGAQNQRALANKIGRPAFETCRIITHDDRSHTSYVGKTSYGTPVYVNKELLASDLILGIGGIYPQHTTGFGGGSKLALGVLGRRSIVHLHYGNHKSVGGTYNIENSFRRDLDEIAQMIGLRTIVTVHINADSEIVWLWYGDHLQYYPKAVAFTLRHYSVPSPYNANVVIANTYPSDVSYTFMRKGFKPLRMALPDAIKVAIGTNAEGIGCHGIFPQGEDRKIRQLRELRLRMSTMSLPTVAAKVSKNLMPFLGLRKPPKNTGIRKIHEENPLERIWHFQPPDDTPNMQEVDGIRTTRLWNDIIDTVDRACPNFHPQVILYPCSSLLCLRDNLPTGAGSQGNLNPPKARLRSTAGRNEHEK